MSQQNSSVIGSGPPGNVDALHRASVPPDEATEAADMASHADGGPRTANPGPLSHEDFLSVLQGLDGLGLTWTADNPPTPKPKPGVADSAIDPVEVAQVADRFPQFPRELSAIVWYVITGNPPPRRIAGDSEQLEKKAASVREYVVSPGFVGEFLLQNASKVPYFLNFDWEVVVKTYEEGVEHLSPTAYGLLTIQLRSSDDEDKVYTFAADERRVDSMVASLKRLQSALQQTRRATDILSGQLALEPESWDEITELGKDNASTSE